MKIGIWILNIDDYEPEITSLCLPTIKQWARKLSADLNIITERKFKEWHVTYEKAQVYESGKDYHWNIVMDTDVLVHQDCPNPILYTPIDHVCLRDTFPADHKNSEQDVPIYSLNDYFLRDQRKIAISGVYAMASCLCHDFWTPLPGKQEDYADQIFPNIEEQKRGITYDRMITEYWQSYNLARYGLKYTGFLPEDKRYMFYHSYTATTSQEKLVKIQQKLKEWNYPFEEFSE